MRCSSTKIKPHYRQGEPVFPAAQSFSLIPRQVTWSKFQANVCYRYEYGSWSIDANFRSIFNTFFNIY